MESVDLKSLNLTIEESKDIINFIAKKRSISTKKLLLTIKPNLKHKNNEILTTKTQQNMAKTQQKLTKTQQKLTKTQKNLIKTQKNLIKTQKNLIKTQKNLIKTKNTTKIKNTQNLTVCFYHVTYAFQSESRLCSCLNVKELLAQSRREI